MLPRNTVKIYRYFKLHLRWKVYKTSWPLKDAIGNLFHHLNLTLDDYGKQQYNTSLTICDENWVHMLPPTRNFPHYFLRHRTVYIPETCVPYPVILLTQHIISWTILIGKPLPNSIMLISVTCIVLPRWQSTNYFNILATMIIPVFTGFSKEKPSRGHHLN